METIKVVSLVIEKVGSLKVETKKVTSVAAAADVLMSYLSQLDREHFVVLNLDNKGNVNSFHVAHVGILDQTLMHPRELFKVAIISNAKSIILGHNHPSGDLTPSQVDIEATQLLIQAGKLLGIPVQDHLIVGQGNYYSMLENNPELFRKGTKL